MIEQIKTFFERQAFGVCDWLGNKMRIKSADIRLFFIYASFLTVGSPIIIYMIFAFWLRLKKMVNRQRNSVWDL
ncbi:MAG: PspC family transcriptional regulator [Chitinophagales bacterium]